MLAWFVAVYLVRAMMASHIDEQRRLYTERVEAMRARTQSAGRQEQQLPPGGIPRARLGPPTG